MGHLSLGESSKPQSHHKTHLLGELVEVKKRMVQKDEEISQLAKRLERLEEAQARQTQERRWEPPRTTRHSMHYRSQEHDWRVHNFDNDTINTNNNHNILLIL